MRTLIVLSVISFVVSFGCVVGVWYARPPVAYAPAGGELTRIGEQDIPDLISPTYTQPLSDAVPGSIFAPLP